MHDVKQKLLMQLIEAMRKREMEEGEGAEVDVLGMAKDLAADNAKEEMEETPEEEEMEHEDEPEEEILEEDGPKSLEDMMREDFKYKSPRKNPIGLTISVGKVDKMPMMPAAAKKMSKLEQRYAKRK